MWGKCRGCEANKAHIISLQSEIEHLRTLALPNNDPFKIPLVIREADAAISGRPDLIEYGPEQKDEAQEMSEDEIIAERDRVLSGTY